MFRLADEARDAYLRLGCLSWQEEDRTQLEQQWNNGCGVLNKRRKEVSDKSLLGSFHSRVHANDTQMGYSSSGDSVSSPGLSHTCHLRYLSDVMAGSCCVKMELTHGNVYLIVTVIRCNKGSISDLHR